jgi:hypothetical protein
MVKCVCQDMVSFNPFWWEELVTVSYSSRFYWLNRDTSGSEPGIQPTSLREHC